MSIADKITRLSTAKDNIATAITNKGGTVASGDGFEDFASDIATIPTVPVEDEGKDINFYDYDGTLLYAWTLEELDSKTELPPNPTNHSDLVAQGWNWTLREIKDWGYPCEVGQLYTTPDGYGRIFVEIPSEEYLTNSIHAFWNANMANAIDWGDGNTSNVVYGWNEYVHQYSQVGNYVITVKQKIGYPSKQNNSSRYTFKRIYAGNTLNMMLTFLYNLEAFAVSTEENWSRLFYTNSIGNCGKLKCLIANRTVTDVGANTLQYMHSLKVLSLPPSVINPLGNNCILSTRLKRITLANVTNNIGYGGSLAYNNYLKSFIVSDKITSTIANNVLTNVYLLELRFLPTTPPAMAGSNSFEMNPSGIVLIPYDSTAYLTATNYKNPDVYPYLGFYKPASGTALPTVATDTTYSLTWYATKKDAVAQTNPITIGNGKEVYCRYTEVA